MSKVQQFHKFLNQNIVAKLFLYAFSLVVPVINGLLYLEVLNFNPFNVDIFTLNPYFFNWIGFYSCVFLIWAYCKKSPTLVSTIVLFNLAPIGFWFLFSLLGGWLGLLWAMSTLTMPLAITMMFDGFIAKILVFVGLIILLVILGWGIRSFWSQMQRKIGIWTNKKQANRIARFLMVYLVFC